MINTPELDEIIRLHGLWLRVKPIKKLNYLDQDAFEGANLRNANLHRANLRG